LPDVDEASSLVLELGPSAKVACAFERMKTGGKFVRLHTLEGVCLEAGSLVHLRMAWFLWLRLPE
jgi:hypothetical protein